MNLVSVPEMGLISEALDIAAQAKLEKLAAQERKRLDAIELATKHALRMLDDIKSEVRENVLKAASEGERRTHVTVYAWANNGRPNWVNHFMPAFESYLASEGFKFEFNDVAQNDSGGYSLSW
jgi:hypothetical protein